MYKVVEVDLAGLTEDVVVAEFDNESEAYAYFYENESVTAHLLVVHSRDPFETLEDVDSELDYF